MKTPERFGGSITPECSVGGSVWEVCLLRAAQRSELMSERCRPTCVSFRMHLHPDLAMQLAQLDGSAPVRESEVPVEAPRTSRELAFAADDDATRTARG